MGGQAETWQIEEAETIAPKTYDPADPEENVPGARVPAGPEMLSSEADFLAAKDWEGNKLDADTAGAEN